MGLRHRGQAPTRRSRTCWITRLTMRSVHRTRLLEKKRDAGRKEAVCDSAEDGVVVEAAPGSPFEVAGLLVRRQLPLQLRNPAISVNLLTEWH